MTGYVVIAYCKLTASDYSVRHAGALADVVETIAMRVAVTNVLSTAPLLLLTYICQYNCSS
jgi:hypothetical protein